MQISNDQVKIGILAILIAIASSIASVAAYRFFEQKNYWSGQDANYAKYAKFYDAIFSGRAQGVFRSTAPTDFIKAASLATPAVVNIKCGNSFAFPGSLFESNAKSSSGSGVIISPDGYIVTNNHVVEDAGDLEVTLNDKRKYTAQLVGTDPSTDLALLKITAQNLPALVMGNSDSLQIGEWVLAVGNPFELNSTVTAGIVSAKARNINILEESSSIESFIQTDAAVNSGNSGGALVNSNGELVGITSAIITYSGQYEGYSFAVPVNLVQKVIKDIKEYGTVQRGFLGISIDEISDQIAKDQGLSSTEGVYVRSVTKGGASEEAGLLPGDIIVELNSTGIKTVPEFQELVGRFRPGNQIRLSLLRNGQRQQVYVTLRNRSNTTGSVSPKADKVLQRLGIELRNLSSAQAKKVPAGVVVVSIKQMSTISATNMEPGFIITKINNTKVDDVDDALEILENASGKVVLEGVYEGYEGSYFYTFRI